MESPRKITPRSDGRQPGYRERIIELGRAQPRGSVKILAIVHDSHCTRPDGGPCTCNPGIRIERDSTGRAS